MYSGQRPPHHASEGPTTLDHYQQIERQLDGDINATNSEIHTLSSKIMKYISQNLETIMTILNSKN